MRSLHFTFILIPGFLILGMLASCSRASLERWDLKTGDTWLTVGHKGDTMCLYVLKNPMKGHNWLDTPAVIPFIEKATMQDAEYTLRWRYQSTDVDTENGKKVTLHFTSEIPALELRSEWFARPGKGPVRHAMNIKNNSGNEVTFYAPRSMLFTACGDGELTAWYIHTDGGWGPQDPVGVYREAVSGSYARDLLTRVEGPRGHFIPFAALEVENRHGVYLGTEWSCVHTYITGHSLSSASLEAVAYEDGRGFYYTLSAGAVFEVPPVFVGTYTGDMDDAGNSLKSYLWNYSMPDIVRNDSSYPKVQWNAFHSVAEKPASWNTLQSRWSPFIDAIAPLGFEEVMHDVGWWKGWDMTLPLKDRKYSVEPDPLDWPAGMKVSLDYAQNHGLRAGLYLCGNPTFEEIKYLFDVHGAQIWRSDGTCGEVFENHYDSIRAFYLKVDRLQQQVPGFQWENCSGGGRIKDFAVMKRAVKIFNSDLYDPVNCHRAFYGSSFLFPPVQLEGHLGNPVKGEAGLVYCFRTAAQGAPEWFIDAPIAGNDGWTWTPEEMEAVEEVVATYKEKVRPLQRNSDLYHLTPRPNDSIWYAFQYYQPETKKGVVYIFKPAGVPDSTILRLKGLDPGSGYTLTFDDGSNPVQTMTGQQLMNQGIWVKLPGRYGSEWMFLNE